MHSLCGGRVRPSGGLGRRGCPLSAWASVETKRALGMNGGVLRMPIEPMLAAPTVTLPEGAALRGGCWYEPKFDGYRALVFVGDKGARVQSRRGHDITTAFRDVAEAAAEQLPTGAVIDGERLCCVVRSQAMLRRDLGPVLIRWQV